MICGGGGGGGGGGVGVGEGTPGARILAPVLYMTPWFKMGRK